MPQQQKVVTRCIDFSLETRERMLNVLRTNLSQVRNLINIHPHLKQTIKEHTRLM